MLVFFPDERFCGVGTLPYVSFLNSLGWFLTSLNCCHLCSLLLIKASGACVVMNSLISLFTMYTCFPESEAELHLCLALVL